MIFPRCCKYMQLGVFSVKMKIVITCVNNVSNIYLSLFYVMGELGKDWVWTIQIGLDGVCHLLFYITNM